jgi:hypothetical protein
MTVLRSRRGWLLAGCLGLVTAGWSQGVPSAMTGEMPAMDFASASKQANLAVISFSSSSVFDDNFSNSASGHESGGQQSLNATFAFQQTRRNVRWNLSYRPGLVVGAHSWLGNQFSQVLGTTFEVQPATRWSLKFRQDYSRTTDPFERLGEAPLQPALSPLERPNDVPVLPQLRRTASFTGAGVSYRFGRHLTAGLNGSYALQNYSDYAGWTGALINSRTATGNTYISQQVSRTYTTGVEYRVRSLTFPGYEMGARTHSILSFHQFAVSANSSVVVYGGPEFARTRGQMLIARSTPAVSASWSPAAGAIYTWSGIHNRLQTGYSRQISDGGGLQGVVRVNAGWLRLARQMGRRWAADLSCELAQQATLPGRTGERLRLLGAGAGFRRELAGNTSLRLSYDRMYQTGNALGYRAGNHNRVMLSVEQSFTRPLGR